MARHSLALLALLVCAAISLPPAKAADEEIETLVFTQEFLLDKIGKQMLQLQENLRAVANRTLTKATQTPEKKVGR
jgi:hypothetical protein